MTGHRSRYFSALDIDRRAWPTFLGAQETVPDEIQKHFNGRCGAAAFEDAINNVDAILEAAEALGRPVAAESRLLDFGCGWGRIAKASTLYFEPSNITCADIQTRALELVGASGLPVSLAKAGDSPPLPLADDQFDFVMSYSVFSHLTEAKARVWMDELYRVAAPGGVVAVTTRPRHFIGWAQKLREMPTLPVHALSASKVFLDTEDCLRRYDAGEFVFDGEARHGPLKNTGYGEACISQAYAEKAWGGMFAKMSFVPAIDPRLSQSIIVGRK